MRWNRAAEHRRPKILYLADRNILIDDPKDKMFTTFGDARWKIENGEINKRREMYSRFIRQLSRTRTVLGFIKSMRRSFLT
jgi:type I restriction enzyme R subunit